MAKAFGILFIVGMVWVGLELYMEGPSRAFGGSLAFLSDGSEPAATEPKLSTPQRAGRAVERANREHEARYERMLGE